MPCASEMFLREAGTVRPNPPLCSVHMVMSLLGYAAPQNLQNYAKYLDTRIRAYRDLQHDAIRVQSENNRDMRNSLSIEEDWPRGKKDKQPPKTNNGPQRSKTMMGRKLGAMTVEKGLLRETRIVQKMIDAVVECRVRFGHVAFAPPKIVMCLPSSI